MHGVGSDMYDAQWPVNGLKHCRMMHHYLPMLYNDEMEAMSVSMAMYFLSSASNISRVGLVAMKASYVAYRFSTCTAMAAWTSSISWPKALTGSYCIHASVPWLLRGGMRGY